MFEFVRAYGAFANGGYVVQPYAIERIEDSRGRVLYRASKTKSSHQLSLKTAAEMTAMLKTVILTGTGTAANIGKPAAGKTGTTDDSRDAYFVGYTPDVVTGVWVGDDNNKKVPGLYGGTIPARIWKDVMTVATKDYGDRDFDYPEVELENYHASFGKAKVIGEDAKQTIEENAEVPTSSESPLEQENNAEAPTSPKPLNNINNNSTPADVVKSYKQQSSAPVPQSGRAPIPMAVPESLR